VLSKFGLTIKLELNLVSLLLSKKNPTIPPIKTATLNFKICNFKKSNIKINL
jgi:hypothetical protein